MLSRRLLLAIALLALAAGASQLLLWWLTPPPAADSFVGPPRSGYTLRDFHLLALGPDGRPSFTLRAPQLDRREGDDSLYLDAPVFSLPAAKGPAWTGRAQYGWVNADGSLMKLNGRVHLERPAGAATSALTVDTANVTAWPNRHRMASAAPTVIQQPDATLRGVGFTAATDTHQLELLADVHATFQPQRAHPH